MRVRYGRGMNGGVPPKEIHVTLLGTASGPRVHVAVAGIRTLVEAGGERFLFELPAVSRLQRSRQNDLVAARGDRRSAAKHYQSAANGLPTAADPCEIRQFSARN